MGGTVPPGPGEHPAVPADPARRPRPRGGTPPPAPGLRGDLATHRHNGRDMNQREYEVTSGGRVRYAIDDGNRTV